MLFEHKPDFESARRHWEAFWAGEIIDRPCIRIIAPNDNVAQAPYPYGLHHPNDDLPAYVRQYDAYAATTYFGGDAVPGFFPNFGPDVYAAFLGADLAGFSRETSTSWAVPFVNAWETDSLAMDHPHGYWWEQALGFVSGSREVAEGRFVIGGLDLHSNLDCLAAVRGSQELCLDLIDRPEEVEAVLDRVRRAYAPVYDGLYAASGQDATGSTSWLPFYCEGKFAVIQCDFICMIGHDHFRRFVMPALEEEAAFLDHCCYHYDGPDALVHLDDVLSIPGIDAIQWVPGAGHAPHIEWMDLLKKIQAAGKALHVGASVDEVKIYHGELRPEKVFYDVWASSRSEADGLISWLIANT